MEKLKNQLVLKGSTAYFEKVDSETAQRLENHDLVFLNMPLPVGCNYKCPKCFSGGSDVYKEQLQNKRGYINFNPKLRNRVISEARGLGANTLIIAGAGEPLMFYDLDKILKKTSEKEMYTIIFTNGSFLSKEKADNYFSKGISLVFSFDSISSNNYDKLTATNGNYKIVRKNLESVLELAEKFSSIQNDCKIVPLAINTNLSLLNYDPKQGIDEIIMIKDLINNRAAHFVSNITPTGMAKKNWDWLVGTKDYSPSPILKEAEKIYSKGLGGSSRKKNNECAYIHNGVTIYEGYYMMCPNIGLLVDFGNYLDVCISEHFDVKKKLLKNQKNPLCFSRR